MNMVPPWQEPGPEFCLTDCIMRGQARPHSHQIMAYRAHPPRVNLIQGQTHFDKQMECNVMLFSSADCMPFQVFVMNKNCNCNSFYVMSYFNRLWCGDFDMFKLHQYAQWFSMWIASIWFDQQKTSVVLRFGMCVWMSQSGKGQQQISARRTLIRHGTMWSNHEPYLD